MLTQDRVTRKDVGKNEKICDTLDVKEYLFYEEELAVLNTSAVLKV